MFTGHEQWTKENSPSFWSDWHWWVRHKSKEEKKQAKISPLFPFAITNTKSPEINLRNILSVSEFWVRHWHTDWKYGLKNSGAKPSNSGSLSDGPPTSKMFVQAEWTLSTMKKDRMQRALLKTHKPLTVDGVIEQSTCCLVNGCHNCLHQLTVTVCNYVLLQFIHKTESKPSMKKLNWYLIYFYQRT